MNRVDQRVVQWLVEQNISYEKVNNGFKTPEFNIICISKNQSTPAYKTYNSDRIVGEWDLENHIKRLSDWLVKKPTVRIEKLDITVDQNDSKIIIRATYKNEIVAETEFWVEQDTVFWADTRYYNYHIPGWLSKSLRLILRQNINKPIEVLTNAITGSYQKIGFKTVEQVDVLYYMKKMNIAKRSPIDKPENMLMWRLIYDSNSTV